MTIMIVMIQWYNDNNDNNDKMMQWSNDNNDNNDTMIIAIAILIDIDDVSSDVIILALMMWYCRRYWWK